MRAILAGLLVVLSTSIVQAGSEPLIVHEWGTFTSLQDEKGQTIGGVNTDDEPLPPFVHDLLGSRGDNPFSKGIPGRARSEITMRLETPVMYFHLPPNSPPRKITVSVKFNRGLLSQFYPDATTNIKPDYRFPPIDEKTVGTLSWDNLQIGTPAAGPKTDAHVWLAPRQVNAADVTAGNGESERYLFYRGVGHINPPLVVTQEDATAQSPGSLVINLRPDQNLGTETTFRIPNLWLAQFDDDGSCNAIALGPMSSDKPGISINDSLAASKRPMLDLPALRASMKKALMAEGLFDDEAAAMLNTWEKSYFKSGGQRLFYIVPRQWTDQYLPLELSTDAQITRVMIGRLELVSPQQRHTLGELVALAPNAQQKQHVEDLYNSLGRFRAALVLNEQREHPAPALQQFITQHGL
jgi:hypothetical protein